MTCSQQSFILLLAHRLAMRSIACSKTLSPVVISPTMRPTAPIIASLPIHCSAVGNAATNWSSWTGRGRLTHETSPLLSSKGSALWRNLISDGLIGTFATKAFVVVLANATRAISTEKRAVWYLVILGEVRVAIDVELI